jgi:hypothetical protein
LSENDQRTVHIRRNLRCKAIVHVNCIQVAQGLRLCTDLFELQYSRQIALNQLSFFALGSGVRCWEPVAGAGLLSSLEAFGGDTDSGRREGAECAEDGAGGT